MPSAQPDVIYQAVPVPRTRSEALHTVEAVLRDAPVPLTLYGSWARGDFHFDEQNRSTYSDLDLQGDIDTVSNWHTCIELLGRRLRPVMPMRVSIRRADVHDRLSLTTSAWVALGTYAACLRGPSGNSEGKKAYLTAKVLLLLNQAYVDEPLSAIVARLDNPAARLAFAVKKGTARPTRFSAPHRRMLLTSLPADQQRTFELIHSDADRLIAMLPEIHARIDVGELDADTVDYILHNIQHGK